MKIRIARISAERPFGYAGLENVSVPVDVEAKYILENDLDRTVYVSYDNMKNIPGFCWMPGDTEKEGDDYKFDRKNSSWWPLVSLGDMFGEEVEKHMLLDQQKRAGMKFKCTFCGYEKKGIWMKRLSISALDKPYHICFACAENFDRHEKWDEEKNDILWSAVREV